MCRALIGSLVSAAFSVQFNYIPFTCIARTSDEVFSYYSDNCERPLISFRSFFGYKQYIKCRDISKQKAIQIELEKVCSIE